MADFWSECFDPRMELPPEKFASTFCRVCRNLECQRSGGSGAKWAKRIATQEDRLLNNPKFADPDDPRFKALREIDFPSAFREAMRQEIVDRRGDWNVPSEKDAQALAVEMSSKVAPPPPPPPVEDDDEDLVGKVLASHSIRGTQGETYLVNLVERVVGRPEWTCTCPAFVHGRTRPCKHIRFAETLPPEDPPEPEPAAAAPPPARFQRAESPEAKPTPFAKASPPVAKGAPPPKSPFLPKMGNIPVPAGGIMVDGSAPPAPRDRATAARGVGAKADDPWAVPAAKKSDNVVPIGGKVVLGGKK